MAEYEWKCDSEINVMLCCNDSNGNLEYLTELIVGGCQFLHLQGDFMNGEEIDFLISRSPNSPDVVSIYGEYFEYKKGTRKRHVGNIHWDEIAMDCNEAARLVNYLMGLECWDWSVIARVVQKPVESKTVTGPQLARFLD